MDANDGQVAGAAGAGCLDIIEIFYLRGDAFGHPRQRRYEHQGQGQDGVANAGAKRA